MSAQLANASANFQFNGATIHLACSSPEELCKALATFGIGTVAANDTPTSAPAAGKSKPAATAAQTAAATAPAGASASPTAASSAGSAAAPAAQGEAGNAASAAGSPAAAASPASSSTPAASPEVTFDMLKKAFLALSTKADGRAKCEGVLKPFGLAKLSEAKPEQYAAVLAEINKASA